FRTPVNYAAGVEPFAVVVADVNGDGKLDLVVADRARNGVNELPGKGDGTFPTVTTYTAEAYPTGLAVGDFDGDGKPDVAVACAHAGAVAVLRNRAAAPRLRVEDGSGSRVRVVGAPLFQVRVVAEDAEHRTDPSFRGTVRFGSSDPQATLPGDYTF